jgi:hypothetical protein
MDYVYTQVASAQMELDRLEAAIWSRISDATKSSTYTAGYKRKLIFECATYHERQRICAIKDAIVEMRQYFQ